MYVLLLFTILNVIIAGESFILNSASGCPGSPCAQLPVGIDCRSRNLTTFPRLCPISVTSRYFAVSFDKNNLTYVPSDAFKIVNITSAASVYVHMEHNAISAIEDTAFSGIESVTTRVYLRSNQLSRIPTAIGHLLNLERLDVRDNPILVIDARVVFRLQRSMTQFLFNAEKMRSWPTSLHVLPFLRELTIDNIPLRYLPYDAFRGLENLHLLVISNSSLERFPEGVCRCKHLQDLVFRNNAMNPYTSLHDICHDPIKETTALNLNGNGLTTFPDGVFTSLPNLEGLSLANNKLKFIQSTNINRNNTISDLDLSHNLFRSVPSALLNFPNLKYLDFSYNEMYTIERNDLLGLHLFEIDLTGNPIGYIDPQSFSGLHNDLSHLILSYTNLNAIPVAVTSLTHLRTLEIATSSGIDCSCDALSHLRSSSNILSMSIRGQCEFTNETIYNYIAKMLPLCPR